MRFLHFDPVTVRECFGYWLSWRVTAAHKFCLDCMRINPDTRDGNQNILQAPVSWYAVRFIAAWKLGKPYILRTRRELRRLAKCELGHIQSGLLWYHGNHRQTPQGNRLMTFLIFAACVVAGYTIFIAIRPILEGLRII